MARDKQGKRIRRSALRQVSKLESWLWVWLWVTCMFGAVAASVLLSMYRGG